MANRKILELDNGDLVVASRADAIIHTNSRGIEKLTGNKWTTQRGVYIQFGSGKIVVFTSLEEEECVEFMKRLNQWLLPVGNNHISIKELMSDYYEKKAEELEKQAASLRKKC